MVKVDMVLLWISYYQVLDIIWCYLQNGNKHIQYFILCVEIEMFIQQKMKQFRIVQARIGML